MQNQTNQPQKKKKSKALLFPIICVVILSAVFVAALTMALTQETNIGNYILLVTGIVDLLIAFILYRIVDYRTKVICPECGTKRIHHRAFIETLEHDRTAGNTFIREYTHVYHDTYTCPECGEMLELTVKKSGGKYTRNGDGNIIDQRIDPRTF